MSIRFVVLVAILGVGACSKDSETKPSPGESSIAASKAGNSQPTTNSKSMGDNPCEILTEALVRKHFQLGDEIKIDQRLSEPGGYPHCSYNWKNISEEEEAEVQKKMQEETLAQLKNRQNGKKGMAQPIVNLAMAQHTGYGSAHLTMSKEMDSDEMAVGALDSARSYMETRAKAKVKGQDVDFTSPTSDVAGVGSKAYYSAKQRQLSLAYGRRIFHVGATPDHEGDSLELATKIAQELFP